MEPLDGKLLFDFDAELEDFVPDWLQIIRLSSLFEEVIKIADCMKKYAFLD